MGIVDWGFWGMALRRGGLGIGDLNKSALAVVLASHWQSLTGRLEQFIAVTVLQLLVLMINYNNLMMNNYLKRKFIIWAGGVDRTVPVAQLQVLPVPYAPGDTTGTGPPVGSPALADQTPATTDNQVVGEALQYFRKEHFAQAKSRL